MAAGKHQVEVSPPERADGADDVLDVPFLPLLTTCGNELAKYEVGGWVAKSEWLMLSPARRREKAASKFATISNNQVTDKITHLNYSARHRTCYCAHNCKCVADSRARHAF